MGLPVRVKVLEKDYKLLAENFKELSEVVMGQGGIDADVLESISARLVILERSFKSFMTAVISNRRQKPVAVVKEVVKEKPIERVVEKPVKIIKKKKKK